MRLHTPAELEKKHSSRLWLLWYALTQPKRFREAITAWIEGDIADKHKEHRNKLYIEKLQSRTKGRLPFK